MNNLAQLSGAGQARFTDQTAEEAVRGWICGHGLEEALVEYPDLSEKWFGSQVGTIIAAAFALRAEGKPVNILTLRERLVATGGLDLAGGEASTSPDNKYTWEAVSYSLRTLRGLYRQRAVSALAVQMQKGMTPEEAALRLGDLPKEGSSLVTINGKPAIQLPNDGRLISDFASELAGRIEGHGIFQRKGTAFTLDHEGQKLEPATSSWLRTWVEKSVVPYKAIQSRSGELRLCRTMPEDTAKAVLVSPQFLERLPTVERFHPCPMPWLRGNGKIELLPVGIDQESGTFTADPGFKIEPDTAEGARAALDNLLGEFAWPDDGGRSKAVAISAMITIFSGGIMPPGSNRPVFLYVANAEGSGKTTLAQLAGMPYENTPVETAPRDESEWQKKLLSVVLSGRRLLLLDNVKGHLNSGALEAYTTSPHFSGRVLGVSKEFSGEAGATVLITGNGLTVTPDLRRRALFVELFLQELRAEDRKFKRPLDTAAIGTMRREILGALWGMVKAWDEAGRPAATHHNSSFPRWSSSIAAIVEFSGYGCPTAPAEIARMGDTDTEDFRTLVQIMEPGQKYTFAELSSLCIEHGLFPRLTSELENEGITQGSRKILSGILGRFDRRRVTTESIFFIEGKGHQRRYLQRK
jgi:hypothetical protein